MEQLKSGTARPLTLGELRLRAAQLRDQGKRYPEIGTHLNVSPVRARDLCRQHDRYAALDQEAQCWMELSTRVIMILATGKHAHRAGGTIDERIPRLLEIAAAHSRLDLEKEPAIGPVAEREIVVWLQSKGLDLRRVHESVGSAMQRAKKRNGNRASNTAGAATVPEPRPAAKALRLAPIETHPPGMIPASEFMALEHTLSTAG